MKRRLLEPFRIRNMELKNRIVMAPMVTEYGSEDCQVTERTKNYYEARARGGAALIIIEATYVHSGGWCYPSGLGISDDKFIPGMSELVQVIQRHGAKACLQLQHAGREAKMASLKVGQAVAPSPLAGSWAGVPKELTIDEIREIIANIMQTYAKLGE